MQGISRVKARINLLAALVLLCMPCYAADVASWYGEKHRGRLMANGKPFDPDKLTAASWFFELGTRVVVEHRGQNVVVVITDRGPNWRLVKQGRKLDLSRAAFAKLADPALGLIEVTIKKQGETHPTDG